MASRKEEYEALEWYKSLSNDEKAKVAQAALTEAGTDKEDSHLVINFILKNRKEDVKAFKKKKAKEALDSMAKTSGGSTTPTIPPPKRETRMASGDDTDLEPPEPPPPPPRGSLFEGIRLGYGKEQKGEGWWSPKRMGEGESPVPTMKLEWMAKRNKAAKDKAREERELKRKSIPIDESQQWMNEQLEAASAFGFSFLQPFGSREVHEGHPPKGLPKRYGKEARRGLEHAARGLEGGSDIGGISRVVEGIGQLMGMVPGGQLFNAASKFAGVLLSSIDGVNKWTQTLHDANMRFSEFSAGMAQVKGERTVQEIELSKMKGDELAESAHELSKAQMELKRSLAPIEIQWQKFQNSLGTKAAQMATGVVVGARHALGDEEATGDLLYQRWKESLLDFGAIQKGKSLEPWQIENLRLGLQGNDELKNKPRAREYMIEKLVRDMNEEIVGASIGKVMDTSMMDWAANWGTPNWWKDRGSINL